MIKQLIFLGLAAILCSCSQQTEDTKETTLPKQEKANGDSISADSIANDKVFDAGLQTQFVNYSAKKCFTENPDEFLVSENGEFCAERKVKLLVVKTTDLKTEEAINKELYKLITDQKAGSSSMQAFVNKVKTTNDIYEAAYEEWACSVVDQSSKMLTVGINYDYMGYGAAHGMSGIEYVNFSLENGKVFKLEDVLTGDYKKELKKIGEKRFLAENGREGWDFTPRKGDFFLSKNYAFTQKGIVFSYGQYEIGSYAMGIPQFTISYDLIKDYISADSPLNSFVE
jgi:hypothetical protein